MARLHLLVGLVALAPLIVPACKRKEGAPVSADPATSATKESRPATAVLAWLDAAQVDDQHFAKSTLYTWTTVDQIDELRAAVPTKQLLSRAMSQMGTTEYELDARANPEPFARLLVGDDYQRVRFAWTAGWPTVLGLGDVRYGAHLIEVKFKPEAVFARVTSSGPIRFLDRSQHAVLEADVRAHPERLAAVLHVRLGKPDDPRRYREYVIVNETMIEEWSYGTMELTNLVATDRRNVGSLQLLLEGDTKKYDLETIWSSGAKQNVYGERYLGATSFENPYYAPDQGGIAWKDLSAALVPPPDARPAMREKPTATWPPPPVPKPPKAGPLMPGKVVW